MRVALFTDTYLPDINGVVSSVELLRKKLVDHGHDVYVISTYPALFKVKQEGNVILLPGIELKNLYGYKAASPIHYLMLEELRKMNFDIIHAHTEFGIGIFANIVAKQLHIPLVRTYHTTYEDYTHYANPLDLEMVESLAKKAVSSLSKIYGDHCMCLISPSKKTAVMLKRYGIKTPIKIIPTGIEIDRFNPKYENHDLTIKIRQECNLKDHEKMVLFVGRIAEEKSISMLIKTFAKFTDEPYKLIIIGSGPQEDEYHKLAKKLKAEDKIVFLGKRPFSEVASYYHAADAFVSASTTETQGMTYIEALSSKTVVFARYDEVLTDLIEEGKNGFFFNNEDELKDKIIAFFNLDEEKIKKMQDYALESLKQYDANLFVEKVIDVYQDVITRYEDCYKVKRIALKNDYVQLTLTSNDEEETLLVSLDSFYERGIRKDDYLKAEMYDELKKEEKETIAYRICLRAIANKDYTVKQMYDYIAKKSDIDIAQTNAIINKLIERGLLDDRKYARDKIDSLNAAFRSKRNIYDRLRKDGVPMGIIDETLENNIDDEKKKAYHIAVKFKASIHNKTVKVAKDTILRKLMNAGFGYSDASEALGLLDFTEQEFDEEDLLRRESLKVKKHYEHKYHGTELRNRIYHALASKGFRSEMIYAALTEMEWDDE